MKHGLEKSLSLALALSLLAASSMAQPERGRGGGPRAEGHGPRAEAPRAEPHPGPRGYSRITEPQGWNRRPATVDRGAYQHNFQARRSYRIGPYHGPRGWTSHHWRYGQILPRIYWTSQYILADYWLFGLDVPPDGYEWVRVGPDAILVDVLTGEILQVDYGAFA